MKLKLSNQKAVIMTDTKESQINSRHVGNRRVIAPPPLPSETFPQKLEFNSTVNDGRIHLSGDSNSDTTLENASQMSSCCIQQRSLSPSVSSSSLNTATGASLSLNSETNPPIVQIPEPINDRKPEDNSWSRPSHRRNLPEIIINQKIDISSWDFQVSLSNSILYSSL